MVAKSGKKVAFMGSSRPNPKRVRLLPSSLTLLVDLLRDYLRQLAFARLL